MSSAILFTHVSESLTPCQKRALQVLNDPSRPNVFLTGGAGVGKSFLIQKFRQSGSATGGPDSREFPMLASTGAAAVLVGGRTFHSFFGLGILEGGPGATVERASRNRQVVQRLKKIKGLIIDEVSMLSGPVLHVAEVLARRVRESDLPWGGLQIVAVGDFAQLPPVERDPSRGGGWAFLHPVWEWSAFNRQVLETQVRCVDPQFMQVLSKVRRGFVDQDVRDYLDEKTGEVEMSFDGTRLFPRRDQTERFNQERLKELPGASVVIPTLASGSERAIATLQRQAPIPEVLQLKVDALIMIRQNDPLNRWVNGTLGHVRKIGATELKIELLNGRTVSIEKGVFSLLDGDGDPIATLTNFPVNLAWASTIHKAQGATLERMAVDLSRLWEPGQAYVALSRLTRGGGLRIARWDASSIKVDPDVVNFLS